VADGLLGIWREPIEQKGLRLIYEPGNPPDTCYNATLLQRGDGQPAAQCLHYTEHGFIRLTLNDNGFVVEDSGVGIPEEKREAMFQPFVRGNEKRGEGWGWACRWCSESVKTRAGGHLSTMEPNGCRFEVIWASAEDR
jgi:signal transduction histidine kinase